MTEHRTPTHQVQASQGVDLNPRVEAETVVTDCGDFLFLKSQLDPAKLVAACAAY